MSKTFTYSILQYKHSVVLGEAINVGILFQFPEEEKIEFVSGNSSRLKAIYPDFDQTVYNYLIRVIEQKLIDINGSLFSGAVSKTDFKNFINSSILPEDATVLQFKPPSTAINSEGDLTILVDQFSKLLLPGIITKKPEIIRHNENFLIKKFVGYISEKNKSVEKKFEKNKVIKANVNDSTLQLKFDLAWKNGSTNLIRPVSFDLSDEQAIQNKSTQYLGHLTFLNEYAKENNLRFDFIVSKPQNPDLISSYQNALNILDMSKAPKRIITEVDLENYSEETVKYLSTH